MKLADLPRVYCQNRTRRTRPCDLIVFHTNEGPEGVNSAEGLAGYLRYTTNGAGYNVIVDENSAVVTAELNECVWGAGGVNSRAWHICETGFAAQSLDQWHDASSVAAGRNAADLVHDAAWQLGVPVVKIHNTSDGAPKGVCGHGDVSAYHSQSMGHTDPGPNFPWDEFIVASYGIHPEDPPLPKPTRDETMNFIQTPTVPAIATTNGQTKNIFGSPKEFAEHQWMAGVNGLYIGITMVSIETWNNLPTVQS